MDPAIDGPGIRKRSENSIPCADALEVIAHRGEVTNSVNGLAGNIFEF
jgi:hypothetical protein